MVSVKHVLAIPIIVALYLDNDVLEAEFQVRASAVYCVLLPK